jgi:hypothetical protein
MVSLFIIFELLQEEEINYIFSLLAEKPLDSTLNPYRVNQIINGVLMQKINQIEKENPTLLAKLQTAASIPLQKIFAPSVRRSFPNV